ncbi:MAG: hypothetical protein AAF761_05080 [Pseudomonadota bacterium]
MGDQKPSFALDLSNDGVALWHRKGSSGWAPLGQIPLNDPAIEARLIEMRDAARVRGRATVVRIPRSEVLLTKVRLGVFEGEAAQVHARKQVEALTPYPLDEIAFDLGEKGLGNMAPVGVVARQTLMEADAFARSHGFDPIYFTTQYADREFDREPRFYMHTPGTAGGIGMKWLVPWVAAAAVGLTAGFVGYSYISSGPGQAITTALPTPEQQAAAPIEAPEAGATPQGQTQTAALAPAPQETPADANAPAPENQATATKEPAAALATLGLSDVAPALPGAIERIPTPAPGSYPELRTARATPMPDRPRPPLGRLIPVAADVPSVDPNSDDGSTAALRIADARRDLPEVGVTDRVVAELVATLSAPPQAAPAAEGAVTVVRLTAPGDPADLAFLNALPRTGDSKAQVSARVTANPAPLPPPVSLVTAEPGTLTPTPEGTLGPGNILIVYGRPALIPPLRPGTEPLPPAPDPLAGSRPRLRPERLVSEALLASLNPVQGPPEPPSILDLADPALANLRPRLRPQGLVPTGALAALTAPRANDDNEDAAPVTDADGSTARDTTELALADPAAAAPATSAEAAPNATADTSQTPAPAEDPVALADPALASLRPQARPADLTPAAAVATLGSVARTLEPEETPAPEVLAALPDPTTETTTRDTTPGEIEALTAPQTPEPQSEEAEANQEDAPSVDLLALADPNLANLRARARPASLSTDVGTFQGGLLALADPSLRTLRARPRPDDLVVLESAPAATLPQSPPDAPAQIPGAAAGPDDPAETARAAIEAAIAAGAATDSAPQNQNETAPSATALGDQPAVEPQPEEAVDIAAVDPAQPAETLTTDAPSPPSGAALLALADPNLANLRARPRPNDLSTELPPPLTGLLALADPSLRDSRPRARPSDLRVIEPPLPPEQAAAERIANASPQAVAESLRPRVRPTARIARAVRAVEQSSGVDASDTGGTTRATASTPRSAVGTARPAPGPTATTVARAATERTRFSKSRMSLVGVFGTPAARRALVRLPTGRYVKVKAGDRVSGWQVSAIGESSLRIRKGSRNQTLRIP